MLEAISRLADSAALPAVEFPLTLRRAWARDRLRMGLEYRDPAGRSVVGQWFADPQRTMDLARKLERGGGGAACAGTHVVALHPRGVDPKLPGLRDALAHADAELVSHRPGRRAVVRSGPSATPVYTKVLRPNRCQSVVRANEWVDAHAGRRFATAPLVSCAPEDGLVSFEALPGRSLHGLVAGSPRTLVEAYRVAGVALRSLHVEPPTWANTHSRVEEAALLQQRLGALLAFRPHLEQDFMARYRVVVGELSEQADDLVVVHRDFYDKQIVVSADGAIGLLDFDTLAGGPRELDISNAIGHLELRVLQRSCDAHSAALATSALLEGYGSDSVSLRRVGAYLDATRLRLAMLYSFWPKWSGLAEPLLASIGRPPTAAQSSGGSVRVVVTPNVQPQRRSRAAPLVFVVGCPRSGTTMLERMLGAHPDIAMTHETHWITKYADRRGVVDKRGDLKPGGLDTLFADHRFERMAPSRHTVERWLESGPLPYHEFIRLIFDQFRRRAGRSLVGDKSTGGYLRDLPRLHRLCPQSRIVHLVRDGRDVCLSMLGWPKAPRAAGRFALWSVDPVATTAAWWRWHVMAGVSAGRPLGEKVYREMRYEQLVAEPEARCAELARFLGFAPDESMAAFHVGRSRPARGRSANAAWLPPIKGLRDWREQMPAQDIELFEAIAGDALTLLGYERMFEEISPAVAAIADERQEQWNGELGARRRGSRGGRAALVARSATGDGGEW